MADEQDNKDQQVEFVFEYDPNYRLVPANGAWGGITPRGDIRIDFFVESQAIPHRVVNKIDIKANAIGEEIKRVPEKHFVRQIQVSILMNPSAFESLGEWIQDRLEQLKELSKGDSGSNAPVSQEQNRAER
ncbi:MAG: hypothetical protein AB1757_11845 [Acidobacteriota bacterium]